MCSPGISVHTKTDQELADKLRAHLKAVDLARGELAERGFSVIFRGCPARDGLGYITIPPHEVVIKKTVKTEVIL